VRGARFLGGLLVGVIDNLVAAVIGRRSIAPAITDWFSC